MAVRVPPHRPVDVHVLDKQGHEQIQEEQELKQQAAVQRELGDPRVPDRLRSDEGREGGRGQTHRVTAPERGHPHMNTNGQGGRCLGAVTTAVRATNRERKKNLQASGSLALFLSDT